MRFVKVPQGGLGYNHFSSFLEHITVCDEDNGF